MMCMNYLYSKSALGIGPNKYRADNHQQGPPQLGKKLDRIARSGTQANITQRDGPSDTGCTDVWL